MITLRDRLNKIYQILYSPLDISGLAFVRIFFGFMIMYESFRYTDLLRIIAKFTWQDFHFKFRFFEWVPAMPTNVMLWLFIIYGIAGFLITIGLFYRAATLTATFCITYIFLLDKTNYLNHFYLIIIFSTIMFFIPAHKGWSVYALINKDKAQQTTPGWTIWLLRGQIALVYFYAAIAKMNVDWINGMPLYDWIGGRADTATGLEAYLNLPVVIYAFSYGGLIYDLLVAPMLLFKRTRALAFCLSLSFHLTNYYLFNIGVFPWFMIGVTTIFFEPDWLRSLLNFFFPEKFKYPSYPIIKKSISINSWQKVGVFFMASHMVFQILFPLRHFAYPGYVGWDEAGHNFAWHMKLRGKGGKVMFTVMDPDSKKFILVDPQRYLTERQVTKMSTRPDMLLQFAHHLRDKFTPKGEKPAEVYAETRVSINGREPQRLIDPTVNLSNIEDSEVPGDWVFPIRQPVWNAKGKRNRFGPALKMDEIALKAIHRSEEQRAQLK